MDYDWGGFREGLDRVSNSTGIADTGSAKWVGK
jgi:hypothetical protein